MKPIALLLALMAIPLAAEETLRPPATPLVTHTPYFSIWSPSNLLTESDTIHWTGHAQPIAGFVRIDGVTHRVLGAQPKDVPALEQTGFRLTPTRSIYTFASPAVGLTLTFNSPLLFDDLELLGRPVTYVTWDVETRDGKPHEVEVMFAADGAVAVDNDKQSVTMKPESVEGMVCVRMGTPDQPVAETRGDDRRIDWGYAYVAAPSKGATSGAGPAAELVKAFAASGKLGGAAEVAARAVADGRPSIAVAVSLGSTSKASATTLMAYDEVGSVLYFGDVLQPYWKRNGMKMADALTRAVKDQADVEKRCEAFDTELTADATKLGGPAYAALCALAHRQAVAANGLAADAHGAPLLFPKENHSNGCISTVDVLYPQIPQLLLMCPTLAKAVVVPPADYGASAAWKYPYAPHDLGTYPHATGQVYGMNGADANRMPVEECGNMILAIAAIAHQDGNAKFAERWWPQLETGVRYLEQLGFDPGNQLCTDDFAGHLAHNANLSIKSIEAIAAYGKLCGMRGDKASEDKYLGMARDFAKKWIAAADDGEKFRLAFDRPGSWSQKYNLVWDRILDLNVFPVDVAEKEMAWYRKSLNKYGLPLDSRKTYTKSDWTLWSATLRGGQREDIELFSSHLLAAFNEMPQRLPMTDWLETATPKKVGFTARSVVGGYFMPFLADKALWKKYASRDAANAYQVGWAPQPVAAPLNIVVPLSATTHEKWRYTTKQPAKDWAETEFDDKAWTEGPAGFGTAKTPGANLGTVWDTPDLWIRRTFKLPAGPAATIVPYVIHDEDTEIYIDGQVAVKLKGFVAEPQAVIRVTAAAQQRLKPGATIQVAVHVHNTAGGQYIDLGFATLGSKR